MSNNNAFTKRDHFVDLAKLSDEKTLIILEILMKLSKKLIFLIDGFSIDFNMNKKVFISYSRKDTLDIAEFKTIKSLEILR